MDVDADLIKEKLNIGKGYIKQIMDLIKDEYDEFIKDYRNIYSGERLFVVLSTVIIDLCTHIVSHSHCKTPFSYSECIMYLAENDLGILPDDLVNEIVKVVRMRNKLAHQYENIDSSTLYESLGKIIQDFKQFQKHLEEKFNI